MIQSRAHSRFVRFRPPRGVRPNPSIERRRQPASLPVASRSCQTLDRMRRAARIVALCFLASSFSARAAEESVSFTLPSAVTIRIIEAPFVASKHQLKACPGGPEACLIDGRLPLGTDGEVPKTYVKSISASFKGRTYALDASQMFNAWAGRAFEVKLRDGGHFRYFGGRCEDRLNCIFRGLFSDGAGAFVAEWKVVNGTSQRTALTSSSDVVAFFMNNIDPPVID